MTNECANRLDVNSLLKIRMEKEMISEREKEMTQPLLTDLALIPLIYNWYCEERTVHSPIGHEITTSRKIFVFIIVYLYSPASIIKRRIERGIILTLSEIFNCYKYTKNINCLFSRTLDLYPYNKGIRNDIQLAYDKITNRLISEGYL